MRWNSEVSLPTTVCQILCVVNNIACFIFVVILLGLLSAYLKQTTGDNQYSYYRIYRTEGLKRQNL